MLAPHFPYSAIGSDQGGLQVEIVRLIASNEIEKKGVHNLPTNTVEQTISPFPLRSRASALTGSARGPTHLGIDAAGLVQALALKPYVGMSTMVSLTPGSGATVIFGSGKSDIVSGPHTLVLSTSDLVGFGTSRTLPMELSANISPSDQNALPNLMILEQYFDNTWTTITSASYQPSYGLRSTDEYGAWQAGPDEFSDYESCDFSDWDGNGAKPITAATIQAARRLKALLPPDAGSPDIAAAADGTIGFEWRSSPNQDRTITLVEVGPGDTVKASRFYTSRMPESWAPVPVRSVDRLLRELFPSNVAAA
jgi:hypothetical protein